MDSNYDSASPNSASERKKLAKKPRARATQSKHEIKINRTAQTCLVDAVLVFKGLEEDFVSPSLEDGTWTIGKKIEQWLDSNNDAQRSEKTES
jgi:hypothetical protein